jgi:hypothetical protein
VLAVTHGAHCAFPDGPMPLGAQVVTKTASAHTGARSGSRQRRFAGLPVPCLGVVFLSAAAEFRF